MNSYSPKDYWSRLAEEYALLDEGALAPVLHPQAPFWFNELIDELQFHALRRAISLAKLSPGSHVLDVGCGTGRWVRRYEDMGFFATGLDATLRMLDLASQRRTRASLIAGSVYQLPVADSVFDCVSDITVIQHIPTALQHQALRETMRVLKPGGHLILVELTRGEGSHVFPRRPQEWIQEVTSCNGKLISWFGQEFLPLDRFFVRLAQFAYKKGSFSGGNAGSQRSSSWNASRVRRVYWALRHVTAGVSTWIDPIVGEICPADFATHGVFVFQK